MSIPTQKKQLHHSRKRVTVSQAFQLLFLIINSGCTLATQNAATQPSLPRQASTERESNQFRELEDRYFNWYLSAHPFFATSAGIHDYDSQTEDLSSSGLQKQILNLRTFLLKIEDIDPELLPLGQGVDYLLLKGHIQGQLLDLEEIRFWETNPEAYLETVSMGIYTIISQKFAPAQERLRSAIEREKSIPRVLREAKLNLKNPPRVFTQSALEQLPGMIDFFKKDVYSAFEEVQDPKALEKFNEANLKTIASLEEFGLFLKGLLPRSNGDFRLGPNRLKRKLYYEDRVEEPLNHLKEIGLKDLRKNQRAFQKILTEINPRDPKQALADYLRTHPATDQVIPVSREIVRDIQSFLKKHSLVTLPNLNLPLVEETPAFQRSLTEASLESPGPFEIRADTAYYYITLPNPQWSQKKKEEFFQGLTFPRLVSTGIHETLPGHFLQFLWNKKIQSRTRKLLSSNTNVEGWAHYTEQMMLEEGYGGHDAKLLLGQLHDALLRNARFLVSIGLHAEKMTLDEATRFFVKEGYQSQATAEMEAKRGTSDPTYLYYTLGKLQILQLRDDYRAWKGNQFSLREFHDRFLEQGYPPIPLVRKILMSTPEILSTQGT